MSSEQETGYNFTHQSRARAVHIPTKDGQEQTKHIDIPVLD